MSRTDRDSVRVRGEVRVTGRWDLKRWGFGLFLSIPILTESKDRESQPESTSCKWCCTPWTPPGLRWWRRA